MAKDPGLAGDTCIFMEAIPGDQGNQNTNDVWWLSPDITLKGHATGLENADVGSNKIAVKFHRKAAGTCTFPGDENITVQAWVANPSLVMSPQLHGSAARVGFIGSPLPAEGGHHIQEFDFVISPISVPVFGENPRQAGPKCLVAICYPESQSPSAEKFFVPGDQHLAQHNLTVVSSNSRKASLVVNTFNPLTGPNLVPPPVKLRAVLDLNPTDFVRKMVLSRVTPLAGFQQIRILGLSAGFGFDLTGLQATDIVDHTLASGTLPPNTNPSFEAKVQMSAALTKITFNANLKGVPAGEAVIFHLTQTGKDLPQGGLTLVWLVV